MLCRHLASQFLTAHGTSLKPGFQLSSDRVRDLYNQMLIELGAITKAASSGGFLSPIEGFKIQRAVSKNRKEYVCEFEKYINEHHRLCTLKQTYPRVPTSEDLFLKSDWTEWQENKTLNLAQEQTHLQLMGIKS